MQEDTIAVVKREAVGVFDNYEQLHETIKDLETSGFGRRQISVRGSDAATKEQYGRDAVEPEQLEDDSRAPRSPIIGLEELGIAQGVLIGAGMYIGAALAFYAVPEQSTGASIATAVAATVLGALVGAALARYLGRQYKNFFLKQEDRGGLVIWVETPDIRTVERAQSILAKHGAHDIHVHDITVAA